MTRKISLVAMTIRDSNLIINYLKLTNMKKYLFSALALPLLFACSTDDFEKPVASNDPFPGIEKVNATFYMDEGPVTRMDNGTGWTLANGDLYGLAWMQDGLSTLTLNGKAYQNHPLTQTSGIFQPTTSIYTGKYYLYRPYDETVVEPAVINFNSLVEQPLADGMSSQGKPWKALAESAIIIADKWTEVTKTGTDLDGDGVKWNVAGREPKFKIYAAFFSNQTGLDLTYQNNNVAAPDGGMHIAGATDIDYTIAAGTKIGAAGIYEATVQLEGAAKSFTYAPTAEPSSTHSGTYWADKEGLAPANGFTFEAGAVTLKAPKDAEDGISTDKADNKGWFWFNSLPITSGIGEATSTVDVVLTTSYGNVTVKKSYSPDVAYTVGDCAFAGNVESGVMVWHPLANAENTTVTPTVWAVAGTTPGKETFINQYGNHKGKFALNVDFSKGVMNGMHIKNDAHLQKLLKYYIASGKTETGVVLNLDGASATDKTFKLSKISIALLQTINKTSNKVLVKACDEHNNPVKIIVTQEGQTGDLEGKTEVPALNKVFAAADTEVFLSSEYQWTWGGGANKKTPVLVDANVKSITNEGTLTVNATNVALATSLDPEVIATTTLANAKDATMNITQVTTVKNALTNLGKINVGSASNKTAELRAYNVDITNNATGLEDTEFGVINNYGVVGVTAGTTGKFNNYGLIDMKDGEAITLLTTNEKNANSSPFGPFKSKFVAGSNMMGTVVLPDANPYAIVSVSNGAETGFIKYNWNEATYTHDPGNVKYNTIVVKSNIAFTGDAAATEIQFIEFVEGTRIQVVNSKDDNKIPNLRGIIVSAGSSIVIEKTNKIGCKDGAYLGEGATIYKGGDLKRNGNEFVAADATNSYFGPWSLDQIVEY